MPPEKPLNESAIERLKIARESDCWETGYETPRLLEIL